jgi:quinol monooxygenase YgiN
MIRLNAFIRLNDATKRGEAIAIAADLVAKSLNDEGCIAYDIFGSATREDVLMICETWSNASTLLAHSQSAHFTTLVPKLQELGELKIEQFEF